MIRLQLNTSNTHVYKYIYIQTIYLPVIMIYHMITIRQNKLKDDNMIFYHLITFEYNVSYDNNCICLRLITTYRVTTWNLTYHIITISNNTSFDTNGLMYTM